MPDTQRLIGYSEEYKDVRNSDNLIELIEKNTENMKDWLEWKCEISLLETVINDPTTPNLSLITI